MRHTLSILVENRFGELARIVSLFSARGYNIESLTVAETLEAEISCVTLVTSGDDHTIEQIVKQVDKLVRVLEVTEDALIIEATGEWEHINELVRQLTPLGTCDIVRTGPVALAKVSKIASGTFIRPAV